MQPVPPIFETELEIPNWGVEIETNTGENMENPFRYDNLTGYDKVVTLQYHRLADFLIKFASEDPARVAALDLLKSSYVNLVNND